METILIIEDDAALALGLCRALKSEDRTLQSCGKIREARRLLREAQPDLVILDVNLPDGSGFDFLGEIKGKGAVPVILLTANDMETDIVAGLEAGADDYITKPFSLAVLRARVNTQLRRKKETESRTEARWESGRYRFLFDRMEYLVEGTPVELSKNEQKLIDRIWTDGAEYVDENALSVTVKRLRDKLAAGEWIETVYGTGYRWVKQHG